MAHKMGLIQINMKKATAPETRTYTANSVTKAYDSGNVEFYALNVFDGTNLPYSSSCPGTVSYFIVKYSSGSYSFTTPYKALNSGSTTGAVSQWTMSAVTAPASGKCTSATTSDPVFKNLGRLYSYTGSSQTYTPMLTGFKYKMECWGASSSENYGKGGYTRGILSISSIRTFYVYVGESPTSKSLSGGWNGGGNGNSGLSVYGQTGYGGGGATDIRLTNSSDCLNFNSLKSRIMVAAGAGQNFNRGGTYPNDNGHGGGLEGYSGCDTAAGERTKVYSASGGTQENGGNLITDGEYAFNGTSLTSNYQYDMGYGTKKESGLNKGGFGYGGENVAGHALCGGDGGGGGYFGGGASSRFHGGSGGGSSFISGHPGCVAILETSEPPTVTTLSVENCPIATKSYREGDEAPKYVTLTASKITEYINFNTNDANSIAKATHYSGLYFTSTKMIDGAGYVWTSSKGTLEAMPDPASQTGTYASGMGHTGNGYARITIMPYD